MNHNKEVFDLPAKVSNKKSNFDSIKSNIITHWEFLLIFFLWLFSLIIRITFAITTYGFIFSDEIFQSKEMAHKWLYGLGDAPMEFTIPTERGEVGAARSPLHGLIYLLFMIIGDILNFPWHLVVRLITIVDAVISSTVVPLIYLVTRQIVKSSKLIAFLTALMTSIWFWMIYIGAHSFSNVFYTPLLYLGFWLLLQNSQKVIYEDNRIIALNSDNHLTENTKSILRSNKMKFWSSGLFFGLAFIFRADALLFFSLFVICFFQKGWITDKRQIWYFIFGCWVSGILILGLLDLWAFGYFWVSPWNHLVFNVIQNRGQIFVNKPFNWYYDTIFGNNPLLIGFLVIFFILLVTQAILLKFYPSKSYIFFKSVNSKPTINNTACKLDIPLITDQVRILLYVIGIFLFYSTNPNKQLRFFYPWFPLFFIIISISLVLLYNFLQWIFIEISKILQNKIQIRKKAPLFILVIIIGLFFTGFQFQSFSIQDRTPVNAWGDTMLAMTWVGEQDDSIGLLIIGTIYFGYYHLHKNITIFYFFSIEDAINTIPFVNSSLYNYVIVPRFLYQQEPELDDTPRLMYELFPLIDDTLQSVGYEIVHLIKVGNNICEIWKYGINH
ncbi:MAG: hypothetical protein ACXAC7_16190 [Candidatus Hodarchaeales archaeon]